INSQSLNTVIWSIILGFSVYGILRLILRKRLLAFVKQLASRADLNLMDEIGYRSVIIGFPLFALGGIFFAAIWAQIAWSRFWGWDPKETWAFITFMFYTVFLHLRLNRGYEGEKSAWLAVLGFILILFNLIAINLIVAGLHSYALLEKRVEMTEKILIVDDEERIRKLLNMYLVREGYDITEAENGEEALELAMENDYNCILLDLMMPKMDGIEVASRLRRTKSTPIIMLTAKGEENNRVEGFEVGADDYIVKPFSPREVVLRVKAILRRSSETTFINQEATAKDVIVYEHLVIDNDAHRVLADDHNVNLTPKEYELLLFLAKSPDKVFDREELLKEVWHYDFYGDLRTVDTHVKRLREKLNKVSPEASRMIHTVWGIGYK